MQNLLPAVRAVHARRLVEALVDAGDGADVDDRVPADALPQAGDDVDAVEVVRNGQPVHRDQPHGLPQLGQDADGRGADVVDHAHQHDGGDEVRHVGDGLHDLLVAVAAHLVEQDGEDQRRREHDGQREQVQRQRVADVLPQVRAGEQALKPLEADVLGALEALEQLVVVERRPQVVHGQVLEQQHVDQDGNDHQVDIAVAPDPVAYTSSHAGGVEDAFLSGCCGIQCESPFTSGSLSGPGSACHPHLSIRPPRVLHGRVIHIPKSVSPI